MSPQTFAALQPGDRVRWIPVHVNHRPTESRFHGTIAALEPGRVRVQWDAGAGETTIAVSEASLFDTELTADTIYQAAIDAGIPADDLDAHYSDLYLRVTPETRALVNRCRHARANVTTFRSQIDGRLWFDLPFAFTPYWAKRGIR